jgi:hypothetical protein
LETIESETIGDERDKKELRANIKDISIGSPSFKNTRKPHEHFLAECKRQLRFRFLLHQSAFVPGREAYNSWIGNWPQFRITVANRGYHHLSQNEIGGAKSIIQIIRPETDHITTLVDEPPKTGSSAYESKFRQPSTESRAVAVKQNVITMEKAMVRTDESFARVNLRKRNNPKLVASARAHVAVELFFGALKRSSPHQRGGFHQKKKAQGNAGGSGQSLNAANEKPTFERRERWDTRGGLILCPGANMSNEEELVVFTALRIAGDKRIPQHLSARNQRSPTVAREEMTPETSHRCKNVLQ